MSGLLWSRWLGLGNLLSTEDKHTRNHPSYKGEVLAVIQYMKKWKHILSYYPLEVHTDATALKYLTKIKNQSRLFTRWYQELVGLNFTVLHKKGMENSHADALTWSTNMAEAPPLKEDEYVEFFEVEETIIRFEE